ncbi:hypothetical protein [Corallococcus exercitus]|uniref:hypothetical protein n=1 Tax=Corallococcus exercitus TaxID=2316736 RepID=UPI0011C3FAA8|nr:hypothetical protein [Corallococcus exercitus]
MNENSDTVHRLVSLLYTTRNLLSSGITYTRLQNNVALDGDVALKAIGAAGGVLFALQGVDKGHAVGVFRTKNLFSADLFLFIDPNTGVFAFRDLRSFSAFLALYWRSMLATTYTTGTVCR